MKLSSRCPAAAESIDTRTDNNSTAKITGSRTVTRTEELLRSRQQQVEAATAALNAANQVAVAERVLEAGQHDVRAVAEPDARR